MIKHKINKKKQNYKYFFLILLIGLVFVSGYIVSSKNKLNSNLKQCDNSNTNKIVYKNRGDIWRVSAEGTCVEKLTSTGVNFNPKLSPDGKYIAYYSLDEKTKDKVFQEGTFNGTGLNIMSMKSDGSDPVMITDSNLSAYRDSLNWSPTGEWLLYKENSRIILSDPIGSVKKTLIDLTTLPGIAISVANPIWSPDGSKVAVTIMTEDDLENIKEDGLGERQGAPIFTQILLFDLNGNLLNKYNNALNFLTYWSPDNRLYFTEGANDNFAYGLESINLDGSNPEHIAGLEFDKTTGYFVDSPLDDNTSSSAVYKAMKPFAFSKDGKMIAMLKQNDFDTKTQSISSTIWVMSTDGRNSHPLTLSEKVNGITKINWLPDNQHIVFSTNTDNDTTEGLYAIDIANTEVTVIDQPHPAYTSAPFILKNSEFSTGVESLYGKVRL